MHACVRHAVPFVLCGSIRDDGSLPDVLADMLSAQDAMRAHTRRLTMTIMVATVLHAIAAGNMTPAYPEAGRRHAPRIADHLRGLVGVRRQQTGRIAAPTRRSAW